MPMMREVRVRAPGGSGRVMERLEQTPAVWEQAFATIMTSPAIGPLHAFWRDYYGACAEMHFEGAALAMLRDDLRTLLRDGQTLTPAARAFLESFQRLCARAVHDGASLDVIAD
ncbi:MAG TPA: hypothetical protein VIP05_11635 [Burkholderiaceae bacterium]